MVKNATATVTKATWVATFSLRVSRDDRIKAEVTEEGLAAGWTPERLREHLANYAYCDLGIDETDECYHGEIVVDGVKVATIKLEQQCSICPDKVEIEVVRTPEEQDSKIAEQQGKR